MGAMKKKVNGYGGESYRFWCGGCSTHHSYRTKACDPALLPADMEEKWKRYHLGGPVWQFDGNEESPTFSPSLLVSHSRYLKDAEGEFIPRGDGGLEVEKVRCHLYLRKGMVQYLGDCSHSLAGQTVPVEPERF